MIPSRCFVSFYIVYKNPLNVRLNKSEEYYEKYLVGD